MSKLKRFISVVLTVIMFCSVFSASTTVLATEYNEYIENQEYQQKLLTETTQTNNGEKAEIVCEVPEKRDEFSKTYKRADGSYTSVISQTPLHTYKNGEWEEIDNQLKSDGEVIKNVDGTFEIQFPETISENEKITVKNNGESIAFSVNNIDSSSAVVTTPEVNGKDIIEEDLSKTVSEITYESVDENTDVQYVVSSGFVKENIIVNDKSSLKDTYSFDIEKGNLTAILDDSNNLTFKNDKKEIVFTIPAPVMTDANNAVSYDIDVTVENADKSVLTLIYTPSKEWLTGNDRVFPVVIDPVIALPSENDVIIEDTVIYYTSDDLDSLNTNYVNSPFGAIADVGSIEDEEFIKGNVLVKFNMDVFKGFKSPEIAVTDVNYMGSGNVMGGNILAKPINGTWDSTTITYDDVYPSDGSDPVITYEDKIIDYFTGIPLNTEAEEGSTVYLNITELFNQWLKGERENNGFALVPENSNIYGGIIMGGYIEATNNSNTQRAYLDSYCTIDYVDTTGTNDSFEYLTQEIGRAGTVNVNTFTRALSLNRSDMSMDGLRLPTGVSFNYNPAINSFIDIFLGMSNELNEENETIIMPYGNNWIPSYIQFLTMFIEGEYQLFTGEGTLVTFNQKEESVTETVDEVETTKTVITFEEDETSDSGYTLELIDETDDVTFENMKLTSPSGTVSFFSEDGFVNRICEAEPNSDGTYDTINIVSVDNGGLVIDYITDGIGRKYDFVYNEDTGMLTEITCLTSNGTQIKAGTTDADLKIAYTYDENRNLTGVTYPDGKTVTYTYDSNGNLIKAQNIDNYNIQYTYDSLGKVTIITEKSGDTQGNFITLEDLNNRQVKITDAYAGVEIQQFGKDGRLHYTFDDKGNFCKSDYAPANEDVSSVNGWSVESENLLKNGSFDTAADNLPTNWDNAFTIDFADITNVYDNSCKVLSTEETTELQSQTVDVDGGKNFTFSLYAKYNGEESLATDKLYIGITAVDEDENETSKSVQIAPTNDFEQYSVSVSTTTETDYVTVEFGLKKKTGNFLVNNAQLERGNGTAEFNYIENCTFCYATDNIPHNWSESTVAIQTLNEESVNAVVLNGGLPYYTQSGETYTLNDSVSAVTQNVKINGKKGETYSVGGWFKGLFDDNYITPNFMPEYATTNTQLTNSLAQLKVSYNYTETTRDDDGNDTQETVTENFVVDFAPHNDSWQYAIDSFVLKADVESVDVTVITKNMPATSYATNISLTKDSDSVLIEDDTTEDNEETNEDVCSCGCEDCAYGENCPCTGAINNDCRCPECLREETTTEDAFGNTLSNKSTDGIKYIQTLSSYTTDGNYLASYTDERGNETTYDYNTLNGILESVTSPIGTGNDTTTTSYEYDEMGNVVSVSTNNQKLQYIYTNDRLTEIITPNGKFKIIYDAWGQVLSVNVVNSNGNLVPLVEYTYNFGAKRTELLTATYTNSSTNNNVYKYSYDDNGNVNNIKLNNNDKHIITYDNLGALTEIKNIGGRTVQYTDESVNIYNASGTLVYTSITDEDGLTTEENYGITYKEAEPINSYDASTGASKQIDTLNIANSYDVEQTAVTDWFGREKEYSLSVFDISGEVPAAKGSITTEYLYPEAEDEKTSSTIEKYVNKTYNGSGSDVRVFDGYYYEYDKQNKISAEKTLNADGTTTDKYSYEYDKLGQLVRFNDAVENKTYTYTYDNNGNILTKSEYAYTLECTLGTATNTITYGYDTQWADKLTTVGDKTITYDNIGNPTNYLGATLTWEGRTLTSYEDETQTLLYEYDENGMRYRTTVTSKEDGRVGSFEYVWVDGKLVSIVFVSDGSTQTAKYLYNDFDEPVGMVVTDDDGTLSTYYYLKNAQGDITNIVSASGGKLVEFTYDAFGNQIVHYQADPSTIIGMINLVEQIMVRALTPFGYRGYCYDTYSGLYYLQSRYYDPQTGRFINADDTNYLNATGTVLGCNLFAYCENDPVNRVDPRGNWPFSSVLQFLVLSVKISEQYKGCKRYLRWVLTLNSTSFGPIKRITGYIYCKNTSVLKSKCYINYCISFFSYRGNFYHCSGTTPRYKVPKKGTRVRIGWENITIYFLNKTVKLPNGSSIVTLS